MGGWWGSQAHVCVAVQARLWLAVPAGCVVVWRCSPCCLNWRSLLRILSVPCPCPLPSPQPPLPPACIPHDLPFARPPAHICRPACSLAPAPQVGVRVEEEDSRTGARHHCCSAYLTFVALAKKDPLGGPPTKVVLPKVVPTDRHHHTIHAEAARRWAWVWAGFVGRMSCAEHFLPCTCRAL